MSMYWGWGHTMLGSVLKHPSAPILPWVVKKEKKIGFLSCFKGVSTKLDDHASQTYSKSLDLLYPPRPRLAPYMENNPHHTYISTMRRHILASTVDPSPAARLSRQAAVEM
ncbi:hypothetical protein PMIN03_011058 [Paraphaeosphaeria minitans]